MFRTILSLATVVLFAATCQGQTIDGSPATVSASWYGWAYADVWNPQLQPNPAPTSPQVTRGNGFDSAHAVMPAASVQSSRGTYYGGAVTAGANAGGSADAHYTCVANESPCYLDSSANSNGGTSMLVTGYPIPTVAQANTSNQGTGRAGLRIFWLKPDPQTGKDELAGGFYVVSAGLLTVGGNQSKTPSMQANIGWAANPAVANATAGPGTASLLNCLSNTPFAARHAITLQPLGYAAPWTTMTISGPHRTSLNGARTPIDTNLVWQAAGKSVEVIFSTYITAQQESDAYILGDDNLSLAVSANSSASHGWTNWLPSSTANASANCYAAVLSGVTMAVNVECGLEPGFEDAFATGIPWIN